MAKSKKKRKPERLKPISLAPLTTEQALLGAMKVKTQKKEHRGK